jgi:hypothetical protein
LVPGPGPGDASVAGGLLGPGPDVEAVGQSLDRSAELVPLGHELVTPGCQLLALAVYLGVHA